MESVKKQTGFDVIPEYKFHVERKWRLDFAIPEKKLGIEMQGGLYLPKGGHTSISGFKRDIEKFNELNALGWTLLLVLPENLLSKNFTNLIVRCIKLH